MLLSSSYKNRNERCTNKIKHKGKTKMTNTNQIQETLKRFRYLVGTLDQNLPQKFIVERKGNDLIYHARHTPDFCTPEHYEIAKIVRANNVIGGGRAGYQLEDEIQKGVFSLYGQSHTFGTIPKCVMEQFKDILFREYQSFIPNLKEICVRTENDKPLVYIESRLKPEENTQ